MLLSYVLSNLIFVFRVFNVLPLNSPAYNVTTTIIEGEPYERVYRRTGG
jgi:hypothetical protein